MAPTYAQVGAFVAGVAGVVHLTSGANDSLFRQFMVVVIVGLVIYRAVFLSALMGPDEDAMEKKQVREEAIEEFHTKREATLLKYAKLREEAAKGLSTNISQEAEKDK